MALFEKLDDPWAQTLIYEGRAIWPTYVEGGVSKQRGKRMTIDPRWGFYVGLALTVLGVVSNSGTLMHTLFSDTAATQAVAWSNFILTVGTAVMTYMHAFSSSVPGPLVDKLKP